MGRFNELRVFTGAGNPELTAEICAYLGVRMGEVSIHTFPNENIFVKLHESVREQDVYIVHSLSSPLNQRIMELLIMLDTCKRASAGRVTAVLPYYAYGRTDKKDQPRVPITARLLADLIVAAGADRVVTIDLHAGQIQGFFNIPFDEMSAMHLLIDQMRGWDLQDALIVSPGLGFAKRARNVAEVVGLPLAIVEKRHKDGEETFNILGEVQGRHCIVVDDEIATGTTLVRVAELLQQGGAREISVCAVHPVLVPGVVERIKASPINRVVVTNTLPVAPEQRWPGLTVLSIAPLLGEVVQRIHTGISVGALFVDGQRQLGRW
jgi:ribose-phosphate pyrophosphokinase